MQKYHFLLFSGAISNGSAKSKPERTASSNGSIGNENMNNNCLEPEKSPTLRNHYRKFTEIQKVTVKEYAKIHGIRAAAKHFSIPKSTVGQWMKVNFRYNPKTGHLSKKTYKVRNKMDLQYDGVAITNISTKPANENDSEAANNESIKSESESTNTNEKLESVNYQDTPFSDNIAVYGESNKSDSVCPTTCEQLESSIVEATHYSQSTKTCENLESEIFKATPGGSTFINERINSSSENTGPDNENQKSQCFLGSAAYSNKTLTVSEKAISFSLNPDSEIPNESAKSLADELNCSCTNLESKSISCIVASPNERINSVSENADSQCENLDSEIAQSLLGHTAYADFHCEQTDCDCKQLESVVSKHLLIFKESQKKAVEEYAKIHGIKATTKHFNITASGVIRRKTDLNDNLRYPKKGHLLRSSCPGIKDKNLDIGIDSGNAASFHRSSSSICDNVESDGKSVKSKTAPTRLGHYKQFTKAQKLAVKEYAKVQGIRAAARKFSIPRSTVYTWNKREFSHDNLRNSKAGRPLSYDKSLDLKILAHVQKQQDNQIPITTKDICSYARKVVKPFTPGFKASLRWASSFKKRHNLCLGKKYLECSGASISNMDIKPANTSPVKHSVRKRYAKRKRLTLMQKLLVKQYAQVHGIEQAAIHFKVSKEMVKIWNRTDFSDKRRSCKTGNLPRPGRPHKDIGNRSCDTQAATNESIKSESESTNTDEKLDSLIAEDTHLNDSVAATVDSIKYESERPNTDEQFEFLTAEDTHFSDSQKTCEKLEFEITGATLGQSTFINNMGTSSIERTDHDNKNQKKTIRSMCSNTASTNEISISVSEKANNSNQILKNDLATTVLNSTASPDESTKYEKVNSSSTHLESDFISCYAESPEGRKESTAVYLGSDSVVYRAASQKEQMNSVSEKTNSNNENLESKITSNRLWRNKKFTKMQKSTVVEYAKMHGIRLAAKHFGVPFSTVYLWYKSDSSDDRARNAHVQRRSCSSYDKSLDFVILAHVLEQQDCQIPVTRKDLCSYARKIVRPVFKGFGATKRWASAFIKRHNLCLSPEVVSTIHEPKSFTKMQKKFVLTPREPYTNFTLSQKLAVKDYAKIHGIPAAMKHFGVAKSTVYTWNKLDFSNDNSRNCKNGQLERRGRPLKYDAGLDLIILAHVLEQQDRQIPITRKDFCSYARKIVTPVYPEFRGTSKWASAFIKRHNLCLSPEVGPTTHDHLIKRRKSLVSTPRGEHYSKFTLSQKLDVKDYAQKHGIPAAMKHFGVPKSTVHTWNKIDFSDDTARNSKTGHLPGSGRRLTYDEGLDFVILAHVLEQQDRQISVTRKDLCLYARKIVKPVCPGFEASYRWAAGFEKRHNLCLHKRYMAKEST